MPDIWTYRPDIVREILQQAGFRCNVEPRILDRAANETCQLAKQNFLGEIYVHDISTLSNGTDLPYIITIIVAIVIIILLLFILFKLKK